MCEKEREHFPVSIPFFPVNDLSTVQFRHPPLPLPPTTPTAFRCIAYGRACMLALVHCARTKRKRRKRFHATTLAVKERHSLVTVLGMFSEEKNNGRGAERRGEKSLSPIKFLVTRIVTKVFSALTVSPLRKRRRTQTLTFARIPTRIL